MNEGKATGQWLQRKDDHKVHKYYKGLQELYAALWEFEDNACRIWFSKFPQCRVQLETKSCERGGQEKLEQGVGRSSKNCGADSQGADNEGSQMGLAGGAAGHDVTHERSGITDSPELGEIPPFDEGQG